MEPEAADSQGISILGLSTHIVFELRLHVSVCVTLLFLERKQNIAYGFRRGENLHCALLL